MYIQQKQEIFQDEILDQQMKINDALDKMLRFHAKHEKNVSNLDSMTTNVKNQQNDALKGQN